MEDFNIMLRKVTDAATTWPDGRISCNWARHPHHREGSHLKNAAKLRSLDLSETNVG
jgi:hypothetical protein